MVANNLRKAVGDGRWVGGGGRREPGLTERLSFVARPDAARSSAPRLTWPTANLTAMIRCAWAGSDPLMQAYHDQEWGVPEHDSRALWEKLMLDGFQAGLAWITVLRKRETMRAAFAGFDPAKVARFGDKQIARLLADPGIIRSRAKIDSTIAGARIYNEMAANGEDFSRFCWSFTDGKVLKGNGRTVPAITPLSEQISKELKRRGFKFVGPTIVYAWMQAVGIVNDHAAGCFRRNDV
jgi:DNA-3-methyladenine glycosylase I